MSRYERRQRYEWTFRGSKQFVLVSQEGHRVTVRRGVVEPGGDRYDREASTIERYASGAEADRAFAAAGQLARGEGGRAIPSPKYVWRRHRELEAGCLASPDDPGPWERYAAWLREHADLRGMLAAHVGAEDRASASELLSTHAYELLGTEHARIEVDYRHGFIVEARIGTDLGATTLDTLEEATATFLAAPGGRFVERLRFGLAGTRGDNDWGPTMRAIAVSGCATRIRELRFDAYANVDSAFDATPIGDWSDAWAALPALETLRIRGGGGGTLGALDLPALRVFVREHANLRARELDEITRASWTSLETLVLDLGSRAKGGEATIAGLRSILRGVGLPELRHLALRRCEFPADVIVELARSPLLSRIRSLSLRGGTMASDAASALVDNAKAYAHLEALDLGGNRLSDADLARIRAVLPTVRDDSQQ
ncbi:MAG: hypothetical protein M3680_36855 [Myxococcota bacterium]|nr:hypothetical protein [Myxococcota bacterium]